MDLESDSWIRAYAMICISIVLLAKSRPNPMSLLERVPHHSVAKTPLFCIVFSLYYSCLTSVRELVQILEHISVKAKVLYVEQPRNKCSCDFLVILLFSDMSFQLEINTSSVPTDVICGR